MKLSVSGPSDTVFKVSEVSEVKQPVPVVVSVLLPDPHRLLRTTPSPLLQLLREDHSWLLGVKKVFPCNHTAVQECMHVCVCLHFDVWTCITLKVALECKMANQETIMLYKETLLKRLKGQFLNVFPIPNFTFDA